MQIEINPKHIEFIDPDPGAPGLRPCHIAYRGVVIPHMLRTPETGAGAQTQRHYIAHDIEERVGRMSAHARLEFYAAVRKKIA